MRLCEPCAEESSRWLDYRAPRTARFASGSRRDDDPAGVTDNLRGRFDDWRATVRGQQALIREHCMREHGTA